MSKRAICVQQGQLMGLTGLTDGKNLPPQQSKRRSRRRRERSRPRCRRTSVSAARPTTTNASTSSYAPYHPSLAYKEWHCTTHARNSPLPTVFRFSWSSSEERSSVCMAMDTANAPSPLLCPGSDKARQRERGRGVGHRIGCVVIRGCSGPHLELRSHGIIVFFLDP